MISQGVESVETQGFTSTPSDPGGDFDINVKHESGFYQLAFRRLRRHRLAMASMVVLAIIAVSAVVGPFLLPAAWDGPDLYHRFAGPSFPHLLGTDELGRDILYRILTGGRVSIAVGLLATLVTVVMGVSVGTSAGYFGGFLDNMMMRFTDAVLSIPAIFLLILISAGFGQQPIVIVLAIGLTSWPDTARIIRSVVLSVREKEYVEAARAVGSGHWKIITRHVLPNALGAIVVSATLNIGGAILAESTLSYLGLGIGAPISSWGSTLFHAQEFIWDAPYYALFPGMMILITVLSINFIGDGLRDAFDPRSFER
ncbi:MAG: ABC transporter permease [Candidatus Dormibacteraceae bacterium]